MPARKAIVHVGTHKTGTKSIQLYLARNLPALYAAGLCYPDTGRRPVDEGRATPGHHDLAVSLMQGRSDLLEALVREIEDNGAPSVLISSEELHPLAFAHGLSALAEALRNAGYETAVVLYLRAQAEYAQSIYAERSKASNITSFGEYVRDILRDGHAGDYSSYVIEFEYSKLLHRLADIFGGDHIVVRGYQPGREPAALVRDMLRVIEALRGPLPYAQLTDPNLAINMRATFGDVLEGAEESAMRLAPGSPGREELARRLKIDLRDPIFDAPFSAMTRDETLAFVQRFSGDVAHVERMASIVIPGAHERDVAASGDPRWARAERQRAVLDVMMDAWFR